MSLPDFDWMVANPDEFVVDAIAEHILETFDEEELQALLIELGQLVLH